MRAVEAQRSVVAALAVAACALLAAGAVEAQAAVSGSALRRCAKITGDDERLACFDALTRRQAGTGSDRETAAAPTEGIPSKDDVDAFGAELIGGSASSGPEQIQSRLIGEFDGWSGDTEFRLENGQVWRQAEPDRMVFRAEAPLVTIRRGAFDTYRLSVEGVNRTVRVRRIE